MAQIDDPMKDAKEREAFIAEQEDTTCYNCYEDEENCTCWECGCDCGCSEQKMYVDDAICEDCYEKNCDGTLRSDSE